MTDRESYTWTPSFRFDEDINKPSAKKRAIIKAMFKRWVETPVRKRDADK